MTASYLMLIFDPQLSLRDVLFEMIGAFSTSGLSTGITPQLSAQSRILSIIMMYIRQTRTPLTVASLWYLYDRGTRPLPGRDNCHRVSVHGTQRLCQHCARSRFRNTAQIFA